MRLTLQERLWQGREPALDRSKLTNADLLADGPLHQYDSVVDVMRLETVVDRFHQQTVVGTPGGRVERKLRSAIRCLHSQLQLQELGEQRVIAIPVAGFAQRL